MKKVLLIAGALFFVTPNMQAKDKEEDAKIVLVKNDSDGDYAYEEVVAVDGVSKEEMFKRAKQWIVANLKTVDNNIQFDDKDFVINNEASTIITASQGWGWVISRGSTSFKVHLAFKDGRYKFRIDNVTIYLEHGVAAPPNSGAYSLLMKDKDNKAKKHVVNDVNSQIGAVIDGVKNAIQTGGAAAKDNW